MAVIVSRLPKKVRADVSKALGLPAPSKYGNVKVRCDGYKFDSLKERDRYLILLMRQKVGEISGLGVHPKFRFEINGEWIGTYTADFCYKLRGTVTSIVEDVKSKPTLTAMYRRNKKLMKAIYGIEIREIM